MKEFHSTSPGALDSKNDYYDWTDCCTRHKDIIGSVLHAESLTYLFRSKKGRWHLKDDVIGENENNLQISPLQSALPAKCTAEMFEGMVTSYDLSMVGHMIHLFQG